MLSIGYKKARNMMRKLYWKMRVSTSGDRVKKIVLSHPCKPNEYRVYMAGFRKLMRERALISRLDSKTAVLEYNRVESEVEKPQWFAATRWSSKDAIAAAEEQGVILTEEQAVAWWKRNERRFQDLMVEHGNEILSNMDFDDGE